MARNLGTLKTQLRLEVRDPDGIRFEDDDLELALNQAYRHIYMIVLQSDQGYFETNTTHDIVSGTATITLPTDHYKTVRIEYSNGNLSVPLFYKRRGVEPNSVGASTYNSGAGQYTFYFRGPSLVLEPTPQASVTEGLIHEYIQLLAESDDLSDDSDELHADYKDMWIDALVLRAAITCLSQMEAEGAEVSTDIIRRADAALEVVHTSLGLRTLSPNKNRRYKGYFR